MTAFTKPYPVSERETAHTQFDGQADDAIWEDCVPCSIVSLVGAAKPGKFPMTLAEAEKLRDAAGFPPTGGTAVEKYPNAVYARYHLNLRILSGVTDTVLLNALTPGIGASIIGRLSNFPAGHRLRRFQPDYRGFHQVTVANIGGIYWWVDPLGPKTGYTGEKVTAAEIATYFNGSAGLLPLAAIPTPIPAPQEIERMTITNETQLLVSVAAGKNVYELDGKTAIPVTTAIVNRFSPYATTIGGTVYRVLRVTIAGVGKQVLAKTGDFTAKPDPTTKTQADVDTAFANGKAFAKAKALAAATASTTAIDAI